MITKLNPAALNDNWGVLCLTLGSIKPDNFDEIIVAFGKITNDKKHYIISVFDSVDNRFMGDAELLVSYSTGDYVLLSNEQVYAEGSHLVHKRFRYSFNSNGNYSRTVHKFNFASVDDYNNLNERIKALENK